MQSSHSEYSQAGYTQQYGYPTTLQSVQSNAAHDLNKVSTGQPGMYSNSGGLPSVPQHHHQPGMTGPSPSPQSSIVQQSQQMNRAHLSLPNYYGRNNAPRAVPNMGRTMPPVVNQAAAQQATQYGHAVQMVQSHALQSHGLHPMGPILLNPQMPAQMYPQRTYNQGPYSMMSAAGLSYPYNNWNNFNNPPPGSANGFYPHQLPSYGINSPMPPHSSGGQQQAKKRIPIIDPKTGKNILDGVNDETSAQKDDNQDAVESSSTVGVQFATQVAVALLCPEKKDDPSLKQSALDDRVASTGCPGEVQLDNTDNMDPTDSNVNNIVHEQYIDNENALLANETLPYYKKDNDLNHIDSYESKCIPSIEPETDNQDPKMFEANKEEVSPMNEERKITDLSQDDNLPPDSSNFQECQELTDNLSTNMVTLDISTRVSQPNMLVEENQQETIETVDTVNNCAKVQEKSPPEGKKNKTKKKKDLNKRGESKEGGDMDAFLDKTEEASTITALVSPATSSDVSTTQVSEVELPSAVTIIDSEILNSIPLPGEVVNTLKNDITANEVQMEDICSISSSNEDKENITEDNQSKIVLKYSYKEDQWSPLNPEGKKQYDRDFLLQLQSQPMSLCKPNNLPNLDVIKDKAHIQRLTEVNRAAPMPVPLRAFDPFMPNYARGGTPRPPHPTLNRRSQQGRNDKKTKIIVLPSNQNIKLHESENAWKPSYRGSEQPTPEQNIEIQDLYRKVRGILNKLTPQKFETLVEQVKNFDITTEEKLNGVIDLIFEKAIDEPNFSVPYANMCKHLALIKVPLEGQPGQVNFRKLLLTKCQKEFEQDRCDELKREERIKAIEAAEPEKQKELKLEYDEEEKKMRMRQLGNIRFIGELFKLNMLIEPIMHECIKKLLTQGDEESLECLCRLLKTIGKELDDGKGNKPTRDGSNPMDQYFGEMQKIVDRRLTSSRVRFMLQDVIDLKKNNWIPRRDENNPKTIDQIHKEAEREAREAQQVFQNMSYSKRIPDDRRKTSGRNLGVSEDGWTPTSKSNKGSYSMVDPSKLKLTKPDEVDSIRLGPGGRGPQSWGKGSSGGNRVPADSDVKTALTNRYSALADQTLTPSFENRRGSQRSAASSRESSRGRNSQLPPTVRKTPSTSRERESLIETVKELNRNVAAEPKAQEVKNDGQVNGKAADSMAALSLKGPELSDDDIEKKTKPLIDEFLHNADFEEGIKCITELASPNTVSFFIYSAINQVLERSSQARYLLGQLLYSLVKKELITFEQYKKGLSGVLENVDDYAVDIPLIWEYMGEIIEPMIEDNKLPLEFLKDILEPCIPSETAGKLVSAVLHCAAKKKGTIKLGEIWRESGLQWADFLGSTANISQFIQVHKLDFTVSPTKAVPKTEISLEEIKTKLRELLEKNEENENIFDWIEAEIPATAVGEPTFIRAFAHEVHNSALTGTGAKCELDPVILKKRIPLLNRYIDHKENLELQTLYAIQHLMNDLGQPKGVLRQIFDILYDDDVISEETFKNWEQCKDPNEIEGKGVALLSVRGFFTWLRETESGEDGTYEDE